MFCFPFAAILFWLFSKCHVIKISKIFGDFVPRDSSLCQDLLPSIRHFENRRGEGPGDEVANERRQRISGISNQNRIRTRSSNAIITPHKESLGRLCLKRPRKAWNWYKDEKFCKWNTNFHWDVPTGKTGLPFEQFHFFWEFSSRANRKNVFHLAPNRNFRNFWLNGKRPLSFRSLFTKSVNFSRGMSI